MKKIKWTRRHVVLLASVLAAIVAFLCWARVPVLSGFPEGEWTDAYGVVVILGEREVEISAQELKESLEGVNAWRGGLIGPKGNLPCYFFAIRIDGRMWVMYVHESGFIRIIPTDYTAELVDTEGSWSDIVFDTDVQLLDGEVRDFWDDGSLYRLMVEKFGDAG